MSFLKQKQSLAKPFLKWAGGKGQLVKEIDARLPAGLRTGHIRKYLEPFAGGGAVFFHVAQHYSSIEHFHLGDVNQDLISCYSVVKESVESLICELRTLEEDFLPLDMPRRKRFYLKLREQFNAEKSPDSNVVTAARLIFLNKTCFNGLYRVNRKGHFNVPFGDYKRPTICDEENLRAVSELLQEANLVCGDFEDSESYLDDRTFVYLDPPYRPLSRTASFTSYSKNDFSEADQIRLAEFCKRIHSKGAQFILSNSDPKNEDPSDHFFEDHYGAFRMNRVKAARAINCKGTGRGQIYELVIANY